MASSNKKPRKEQSTLASFFLPRNSKSNVSEDPNPVDDTGDDHVDLAIPSTSATGNAADCNVGQIPAQAAANTVTSSNSNSNSKRKFQPQWFSDFEWVIYDDKTKTMTCKYCKSRPNLAGKTDFASLTGSDKFKRETLTSHSQSKRHEKCRDSVLSAAISIEKSSLVTSFKKQDYMHEEAVAYELAVKMNTAYCIAKEEMSFTKMKPLILLQKKNGLEVTATYDNDVRCAELVSTIADTLQEENAKKVNDCNYISIMIDGATDSSVTENEAVYVRYVKEGQPDNLLVSLTEVSHAHADGLVDCINSAIEKFGIENWKVKLVGFCADGASVNLGQTGGVAAKLKVDNPYLIDIHCMAHRLELALLQVLKQVKMVSLVNDTLHLVWKTYHFSTKSKRELKAVCEELDQRFYQPKPVKGTRWVPHLDKALKVFIKGQDDLKGQSGQFSAVAMHMESLAETSKNADIAGRGRKVSTTMKDLIFVAFCHFLTDIFQEMAKLSLTLQTEELILPSAINAVESCMTSMELMKTDPFPDGMLSTFITKCLDQQTAGARLTVFQTMDLKGDRQTLIEKLKPHMNEVCETIQVHLHKRFDNLLGTNTNVKTNAAISAFSIFHHDKWPSNKAELELLYGNNEINTLKDWFGDTLTMAGCDLEQLSSEWRDMKKLVSNNFSDKSYLELYKILLTKKPYKDNLRNILHLVELLLVLPISSANCERAFSAQKRIKSDTRSSLSTSRLSYLIVISTEVLSLISLTRKLLSTSGMLLERDNHLPKHGKKRGCRRQNCLLSSRLSRHPKIR